MKREEQVLKTRQQVLCGPKLDVVRLTRATNSSDDEEGNHDGSAMLLPSLKMFRG